MVKGRLALAATALALQESRHRFVRGFVAGRINPCEQAFGPLIKLYAEGSHRGKEREGAGRVDDQKKSATEGEDREPPRDVIKQRLRSVLLLIFRLGLVLGGRLLTSRRHFNRNVARVECNARRERARELNRYVDNQKLLGQGAYADRKLRSRPTGDLALSPV